MAKIPDREMRRIAAYWWAAGRADALGEPDQANEFREFAGEQADRYFDGKVSFLPSIRDQWQEFKSQGGQS